MLGRMSSGSNGEIFRHHRMNRLSNRPRNGTGTYGKVTDQQPIDQSRSPVSTHRLAEIGLSGLANLPPTDPSWTILDVGCGRAPACWHFALRLSPRSWDRGCFGSSGGKQLPQQASSGVRHAWLQPDSFNLVMESTMFINCGRRHHSRKSPGRCSGHRNLPAIFLIDWRYSGGYPHIRPCPERESQWLFEVGSKTTNSQFHAGFVVRVDSFYPPVALLVFLRQRLALVLVGQSRHRPSKIDSPLNPVVPLCHPSIPVRSTRPRTIPRHG